jgi:hypothetical protein
MVYASREQIRLKLDNNAVKKMIVRHMRPHIRRFSWMMISGFGLISDCAQCGASLTIDGAHHESDLSCVRGTSEVGVDLFCLGLVQGNESIEDVVAGRSVIGTT